LSMLVRTGIVLKYTNICWVNDTVCATLRVDTFYRVLWSFLGISNTAESD
jgi:hypothetical protein